MVPLSFAGHQFDALNDGALFWPARRALILADLHFEKASWFARHGQFLPPYDTRATLASIQVLIERHAPREIWCLGDSFHDGEGAGRLDNQARTSLARMTSQCRWVWITGNHDQDVTDPLGGEIMIEAEVDGLILRHEAMPNDHRPELSGHFHPKLRLQRRGRHISRRCFVASETKLILPAFGALTGGLDVAHPEIRRAVGGRAEALVALEDRLLRFPIAA